MRECVLCVGVCVCGCVYRGQIKPSTLHSIIVARLQWLYDLSVYWKVNSSLGSQ